MHLLPEYVGILREQIAQETQALAAGNAPTFEDYKGRVGKIKGLLLAIDLLHDLVKSKPGEERN